MTIATIFFIVSALTYYILRAASRLLHDARLQTGKSSWPINSISTFFHLRLSSSSSSSSSSSTPTPPLAPASHNATSFYPHLDPFWGLDLSLDMWRDYARGELAEGMRRRHVRYGDTFQAREPLGRTCVYTIDPANIRAVTTAQFSRFQKSAWAGEASKHIGCGVLMSQGPAWRRSRALLRPVFARTALDEVALVGPHLDRLVAAIRRRGRESRTFDFSHLASRFSLDVVTDFLFDQSIDSLSDVEQEQEQEHGNEKEEQQHHHAQARSFLKNVKIFEPACGLFMAIGILAWLKLAFSYRKLTGAVNGMKTFFRQRIHLLRQKQQQQEDGHSSFKSSKTSLFRLLSQQGLSVDDMQAELQNIFFASFDTTTALLTNLVHVLARRPDIQKKLRDELAHLQGRLPTKQQLSTLPYLRCVLYEGLRLYTPVATHSRQAAVDTTLPRGGGPDGQSPLFVRAGTSVVWSIYALNRSPQYYGDDWAEFRPERWETPSQGQRASSSVPSSYPHFMPFGSGPRSCMGQQMAQTEISLAIVRLLQGFDTLESRDERPFREAEAVSFYSALGTLVAMH